jgi:hypothetical protein
MLYVFVFERHLLQIDFVDQLIVHFIFAVEDADVGGLEIFGDVVVEIVREVFRKRGLIEPLYQNKVKRVFELAVVFDQPFDNLRFSPLREERFDLFKTQRMAALDGLLEVKMAVDKIDIGIGR